MQAVVIQQDDIQHWIVHACYFNGTPELAPKIKYKFTNRLTRVFGRAFCHNRLIEISKPLWDRASPKERRQLVIHETCHIVATYKHGHAISDHGREWKQCMHKAGVPAERCHHVNRDGLRRKVKRYEVSCACTTAWFGHVKASQVKSNMLYCLRCKSDFKLTGKEQRQ